jgi:hypothetical protein
MTTPEQASAQRAAALGAMRLDEPPPTPHGWHESRAADDLDVIAEADNRTQRAEAEVVTMRALGAVAEPRTGQPVDIGDTFTVAGSLAMLLAAGGTAELAQERPEWWTGPISTQPQAKGL